MVPLYLLSGARLAVGSLTSKADYYISSSYNINTRISTANQWSVVDNYTIRASSAGGQDVPFNYEYLSWDNVCFSGDSGNNYKLEYYVEVYEYNTNNKLFESGWTPNNTPVRVVSRTWGGTGTSKRQRVLIYVRRNEFNDQGERRWLVPSDMSPCGFAQNFIGYSMVTQETLPSEWLETTTQSVVDPLETYTTIVNGSDVPDYDDLDSRLEVPHDVEVAVLHIFDVIGTIMSLKYMTFLVCFSIVMGLLVWLLH